jgi:hypothetical protein
MIFFNKLPPLITLFVFSFQLIFADVTHEAPVLLPKTEEHGEERLVEEITPPAPHALIDLDDHNKKKNPSRAKYSSLGLFLFNTLMFTVGMIVVKTMPGKKINSSIDQK